MEGTVVCLEVLPETTAASPNHANLLAPREGGTDRWALALERGHHARRDASDTQEAPRLEDASRMMTWSQRRKASNHNGLHPFQRPGRAVHILTMLPKQTPHLVVPEPEPLARDLRNIVRMHGLRTDSIERRQPTRGNPRGRSRVRLECPLARRGACIIAAPHSISRADQRVRRVTPDGTLALVGHRVGSSTAEYDVGRGASRTTSRSGFDSRSIHQYPGASHQRFAVAGTAGEEFANA